MSKSLVFENRKSSRLLHKELSNRELYISVKKEIDELVTLLEMARVSTLVICVCNPPALRTRIMDTLKKRVSDSNVKIYDVTVAEKDEHLVKILAEIERSRKFRQYEEKQQNVAFSIRGIENIFKAEDTLKISRFYQNLNLYRDYFVHTKHPVLLWVNDSIASDMTIRAPDFWRARTKVAVFRLREEMMVESVTRISELPVFHRDLADIKRRASIHERLLQSLDPSRAQDKIPYMMFLQSLGTLKQVQGLYIEAKELYQQGLNIAKELGNKDGVATALNLLGSIEYRTGNYDKAKELCQQSLNIVKELGDKQGVAIGLHTLGVIEASRGNYDKAEELLQQSLNIAKELGHKHTVAKALHNLGTVETSRGNYDKAEELYRQSLKIKRELGDKEGIAVSMGARGVSFVYAGRFEDAFKHSLEAAYLCHELGMQRENRALSDMVASAEKLSDKQVSKIMEEAPEEIKNYLTRVMKNKKSKNDK